MCNQLRHLFFISFLKPLKTIPVWIILHRPAACGREHIYAAYRTLSPMIPTSINSCRLRGKTCSWWEWLRCCWLQSTRRPNRRRFPTSCKSRITSTRRPKSSRWNRGWRTPSKPSSIPSPGFWSCCRSYPPRTAGR